MGKKRDPNSKKSRKDGRASYFISNPAGELDDIKNWDLSRIAEWIQLLKSTSYISPILGTGKISIHLKAALKELLQDLMKDTQENVSSKDRTVDMLFPIASVQDENLGIIHSKYRYDAFLSYAHDDDVLHDHAVQMFYKYFKQRFAAAFRRIASFEGEPEVFMDTDGLLINGDLTDEIRQVVIQTAFLIIFVGKSYPNSEWCGKELQLFSEQISGPRREALERTFIIVLDKHVEGKDWGEYLDQPVRPIFERFYDTETGDHFPPTLEDIHGMAVAGPRFLRGVRKVAETMSARSLVLRSKLVEL